MDQVMSQEIAYFFPVQLIYSATDILKFDIRILVRRGIMDKVISQEIVYLFPVQLIFPATDILVLGTNFQIGEITYMNILVM